MTAVLTGLDIAHRIEEQSPGAVADAAPEAATIVPARLGDVCRYLRDDPGLRFEFLSSLTAVDRLEYFEVVYHLESLRLNLITVIKVRTFDRDNPVAPSVCAVWPGANLQEREAYDLMGIYFEGHPDLRRIFLWEGFAGHPLRKDFLNLPGARMAGLERFPGEPGGPLEGRG
ncbi:MAG: NADH-quinone oxidoreductase subunit C [Dehalococcoidia bacterium]|nr:NADH-quinone oxidoreductase subunit C [Dehalococcoidia bacterium]